MHLTGQPAPSSWHQKGILGTPFPFPRVFSPPHPTPPAHADHHSDATPAPAPAAATGLDWSGAHSSGGDPSSCGPGPPIRPRPRPPQPYGPAAHRSASPPQQPGNNMFSALKVSES
ncbi:hypothetical protein VPH35_093970 [Triticum aestivum]